MGGYLSANLRTMMINFTSANRWSWSRWLPFTLKWCKTQLYQKIALNYFFSGASVFESMVHWCIRLVVYWQPACLKSDGILTILTRVLRYWHIWMSCSVTFSLEVIEMDEWCMERQLLVDESGQWDENYVKSSYRRSKSLSLLFRDPAHFFKTHVSVPIFQGIRWSDSTLKEPGLVGQNQWLLRSKDPTWGIFHQVGSKHLCDPRPDHPHALARWVFGFRQMTCWINLGGKNNGTMVGWWCLFFYGKTWWFVGLSNLISTLFHHLMTSPFWLLGFHGFRKVRGRHSFWIHVSKDSPSY